jgi:glycosyltransferase 2 family protein
VSKTNSSSRMAAGLPVAAPAGPGTASASPLTARRLRAVVLGPRGGGTTRRRASDAFRLALAIVVVALSIPVMRANSAIELGIVHALNPPPEAIRWLVTGVFWLGSGGVIAGLAVLALLVPKLAAVRWIAVAAVATWAVCELLELVLGPAGGRPAADGLAGVDTSYPETQLAVTIAVAVTALPYLSRPLHRLVSALIAAAVIAGVIDGSALPVNALSSIAIGWGIAAGLHLAVGSPLGLPSADEVTAGIADLRVSVQDIVQAPRQIWGVAKFTGTDATGKTVELSVYGRDAADARVLAKLWRFCFYRDSGPTLIFDRIQQVEHEAYLTFMAERAGVLTPQVLAVGRFGPSGDAAIVSRLPEGAVFREVGAAPVSDGALDEFLDTVLRLRRAGIAHGALGPETIMLSAEGVCVRDFRSASSAAPAGRLDGDLAAVLAALAVRAGVERTAAAAARVLDADTARGALVRLQRSALDPVTVSSLQQHRDMLAQLRTAVAAATGIEVPKLAEAKRISWVNLVFGIGSLIGIWAIIGVLADVAGSLDVIKGASLGWVALSFVLAQLPTACGAWVLIGAVAGQLPYGRCLALETSNSFITLAGGEVASFAIRVRFFQRQGFDPATALSSGAIASTASWVAKGLLFVAAIGFAAGDFQAPTSSDGDQTAIWVIVGVVLAAGIAAALIIAIPRLRRLASARVRPHLVNIWSDLKTIATQPRKIVYVLVGSVLGQLFVALALGAALHSVGERASIATLLVVITMASMIGGAVPVPGGAGVVEAGLIAGLTSAGVPQDQAVAAVFIQRLFTAYLPPIWGWVTLVWMRRREYV